MTRILSDWRANRGRPQFQVLMLLFRIAQAVRGRSRSPVRRILAIPASFLYRSFALVVMSVDIPVSTRIGEGFRIHHGFGLVVHSMSKIGRDVTVRHGTTIGARSGSTIAPVLGDRVDVGAGCTIIGNIVIGDDSRIGAAAVVVKDVPSGTTVVGNPARPVA